MKVINKIQSTTFRDLKNVEKIKPLAKNEEIYLFDVDNTLYCQSSGLLGKIMDNFYEIFKNRTNKDLTREHHDEMIRTYGSGFIGSIKNYGMDKEDVEKMYDIQLEKYLKKDEELISLIKNLKGRKWIISNGIESFIKRVITFLGLENEFELIIHVDYLQDNCLLKPAQECFVSVNEVLKVEEDFKNIHFFDDCTKNIKASSEIGWTSHLISKEDNLKEKLKKFF